MFRKIMAPVDLAHAEGLERALKGVADLAAHYGAPVVYVGVTTAAPSKLGHNPREYAQRLDAFAAEQAARHGIEATGHAMVSHDPAVDLDATLMKAIDETGADLVVMATHSPNFSDHIWASNGGYVAEHAKASVFLIR